MWSIQLQAIRLTQRTGDHPSVFFLFSAALCPTPPYLVRLASVVARSLISDSEFTRHETGCRKGKKRLSNALNKAKEAYQAKRARLSLSRCPTADSDQEATGGSGKLRPEGRDDGEGNEQAKIQQARNHPMLSFLSLTPVPFRMSPLHDCTRKTNCTSTLTKSTVLLLTHAREWTSGRRAYQGRSERVGTIRGCREYQEPAEETAQRIRMQARTLRASRRSKPT